MRRPREEQLTTPHYGNIRGREVDFPAEAQKKDKSQDRPATQLFGAASSLFAVKVDYLIALILRRQAQEIKRLLTSSFDEVTLQLSKKTLTETDKAYFLRLKKEYQEDIEHNPILLALVLLNDSATNPATSGSAAEVIEALLEDPERLQHYADAVQLTLPSTPEILSFAEELNGTVLSVVNACLPASGEDVENTAEPSTKSGPLAG